jgi:hypothetical protein
MNSEEAREILLRHLISWRTRSWSDLRAMIGESKVFQVGGLSGAHYTLELEAFWDDEPEGNIRVLASIDDGGWRAFKPLCEDFIKAPNGEFVGE